MGDMSIDRFVRRLSLTAERLIRNPQMECSIPPAGSRSCISPDSVSEAERGRCPQLVAHRVQGFSPAGETGFPPTDSPRHLHYFYTVVIVREHTCKRLGTSMKRTFQKLYRALRSRKGQSLVEYSLILALVAIVGVTVLKGLGKHINNTLSSINANLP